MTFSYDPVISSHIIAAVDRLLSSLRQNSPFMATKVAKWIQSLTEGRQPEQYFMHPQTFPTLLFPWWLEKSTGCEHDEPFLSDLTYSTVSGYYFIRMIDNAMDDGKRKEISLLPLLGFFHSEFQSIYFRYFPDQHPFWNHFKHLWTISAEASLRDFESADMDRTFFEQVAARKVIAGRIPMVAFCMRNGIDEIPHGWHRLYDLISYFSQMSNDLSDCFRDLQAGRTTYFLSEGERRRIKSQGYTETVDVWIFREGFSWAVRELQGWMDEMKQIACSINQSSLLEYLRMREEMLQQKFSNGLPHLRTIHQILSQTHDK